MQLKSVVPVACLFAVTGCASAPATPPVEAAAVTPTAAYSVLLEKWTGPYEGVAPFDKIDNALFEPAITAGIDMALVEIAAIAEAAEEPTFDNTLVALERAGEPLNRAVTVFFIMAAGMNTPEIQELTGVIRRKLTAFQDQVNFNEKLFARVAAVHEARQGSKLNPEQIRLVEDVYGSFVRRGAALDSVKKDKMAKINQRLATLFTDFGNRVQADEDTWTVVTKDGLGGLPETMVAAYKAAAEQRKIEGESFAVVNTRSAVAPFLTFSSNRDLRKKVWTAFIKRGDNGDQNDTNAFIIEIVKLRAERAALLGYESHAHWRMSDTMAKEPSQAYDLMMRVWPAAKKRVVEDVGDMLKLAKAETPSTERIEPWDYRYYMEKVRVDRYALDQSEFKNYFELNNMIAASYHMAERLYGYAFEEVTDAVSTYHPDVRVFHVTNKADGSHVGLFYRDDFARQYKRSGAWQATLQGQQKLDGQVDAIVSNNNNFTKGGEGEPVLISLDDARTLFHEFGHALHALSNDTTYPTLGETPRDFVEFPSQVHENWVLTREILDQFARHYKTGEKMPQALIDKMRSASTFNQGFQMVEYIAAALTDMKLHTDSKGVIDPKVFERETLAEIGMPQEIVLRHRLPQFMHLFTSDAYSAGYYSYLWSDVMAADAWGAFVESGDPWHAATAAKFQGTILATGDAFDRAEAYRQFRGRDPKVEALLKNRGLLDK